MNKYLMLSAAALIATTAGANAKGTPLTQFTFGSSGGGAYCDGGTLHKTTATAWAWTHNYEAACGYSYNAFGQGLNGKNKATGKSADMSDNSYAHASGIALSYTLPSKMNAGGTWTLWVTFGGTSSFEGNEGTLVAGLPSHFTHKTTTDVVKNLIKNRS